MIRNYYERLENYINTHYMNVSISIDEMTDTHFCAYIKYGKGGLCIYHVDLENGMFTGTLYEKSGRKHSDLGTPFHVDSIDKNVMGHFHALRDAYGVSF